MWLVKYLFIFKGFWNKEEKTEWRRLLVGCGRTDTHHSIPLCVVWVRLALSLPALLWSRAFRGRARRRKHRWLGAGCDLGLHLLKAPVCIYLYRCGYVGEWVCLFVCVEKKQWKKVYENKREGERREKNERTHKSIYFMSMYKLSMNVTRYKVFLNVFVPCAGGTWFWPLHVRGLVWAVIHRVQL